jgi:hypothetical protein
MSIVDKVGRLLLTVTIAEKVPRFAAVREGLDNLISGPTGGRMIRYIEMDYSPAITA